MFQCHIKKKLLSILDELDLSAKQVKAVNTIVNNQWKINRV